jgi:enamine deaminase RidA (YjgF/YER057c/UK114 family)
MTAPEHVVRPEGLPPSNGYSHVVTAEGRLVFVSGQVPLDGDGRLVGADAGSQADQVFRNIGVALAAGGATFADVVKLTFFVTDLADLAVVREVRDRYVSPDAPPASSLVQVAGLVSPDFRLEVEAVAVVG